MVAFVVVRVPDKHPCSNPYSATENPISHRIVIVRIKWRWIRTMLKADLSPNCGKR